MRASNHRLQHIGSRLGLVLRPRLAGPADQSSLARIIGGHHDTSARALGAKPGKIAAIRRRPVVASINSQRKKLSTDNLRAGGAVSLAHAYTGPDQARESERSVASAMAFTSSRRGAWKMRLGLTLSNPLASTTASMAIGPIRRTMPRQKKPPSRRPRGKFLE